MLTGRAAELRPDINYLHVRRERLDVPQTPKTALPGDFAQALRIGSLNASLRVKRERMGRDQADAARLEERGVKMIPRSGPGRRRAKAIRNRHAVETMTARWSVAAVTAPYAITHGRQHEDDTSPDLLADVLAWCAEHPTPAPLPESGSLEMRRDEDGTITVLGDVPDVLAISENLLAVASGDRATFNGGVLTMDVQPKPLRYRPLGPDPRSFVIVFERIREA